MILGMDPLTLAVCVVMVILFVAAVVATIKRK